MFWPLADGQFLTKRYGGKPTFDGADVGKPVLGQFARPVWVTLKN